ncbi:MAG: hypothetical protein K0Q50_1136 [Vampirovibrio sp.]|jgi:hypothetical protein|nr:hypothetical protein [Vampirovibrio sp.]
MKKMFHQRLISLGLVAASLFGGFAASSLFSAPAQAQVNGYGFAPQRYKAGYTYGNGVYFAPYEFTIYTQPDETAPMVGTFRWSRQTAGNSVDVTLANGDRHAVYADHLFFCFYPQWDVAMMAVVGDDDKGWVEIVYDQASKKTGWVRLKDAPQQTASATPRKETLASLETGEPAHFGVYETWLEFMKLNAKPSGIYWLSGVKDYHRSVRSTDSDDAKLIPVTIIRDLKVRHVRGNWLLVEVLDFERNMPIGWVRWRDDDGNLMVFPNISGQHMPTVTTSY